MTYRVGILLLFWGILAGSAVAQPEQTAQVPYLDHDTVSEALGAVHAKELKLKANGVPEPFPVSWMGRQIDYQLEPPGSYLPKGAYVNVVLYAIPPGEDTSSAVDAGATVVIACGVIAFLVMFRRLLLMLEQIIRRLPPPPGPE
ncbi:MAG: hypothetical protein AB1486_06160 [Planctomycetota bacterium]